MDTGTEDQFAGSDRGLHDGFRLRGIFGPRERFAHCREARGYCGAGCGSVRDSAGEFFFSSRRRHTCSLRDWSSDVCSSDLRMVSEATDGDFTIRIFAPGEIVPALEARDATSKGFVEASFTASYYSIGTDPAFMFGTVLRSEERRVGKECRSRYSWFLYRESS